MRDIMTPEEVAEAFRVPVSTVLRLIRSHELGAVKLGSTYRILGRDLEQFLRANSNHLDVRRSAFERVLAIADRNPDVNSDDVLEELERIDDAKRRSVSS
jgi:excisionase family DNA binding protein